MREEGPFALKACAIAGRFALRVKCQINLLLNPAIVFGHSPRRVADDYVKPPTFEDLWKG